MRVVMIGLPLLGVGVAAHAQPEAKTPPYEFTYSYPKAAARIAPLRAWLDADKAVLRAKVIRDAAAERAGAKKEGYPFRGYSMSKTWKLVTATPRFVSLSGELSGYTGGAHGFSNSLSLVWDKTLGRRIESSAVFASPATLQAVMGKSWCAWLKTERTRRIGSDAGSDAFFQCPQIKELTLLLGSSNGRRIDRIGLIADQYVAGSYAEGPYETTLPVTAAILQAVKPAYRADFALR